MGVTDREITPFSLPSLGSIGQGNAGGQFTNSNGHTRSMRLNYGLFAPSFQDIVVTEEVVVVQDQGWWWIRAASDFMVESENRVWFLALT